MITLDDLDRILEWMQAAGLQSLSVSQGDVHLRLTRAATPAASTVTRAVVTSAMGLFVSAHPRRPQTALKPGERVAAGAIVGFLQAGPTLVPVTVPTAGRVVEILAAPGALLGYGAPVLTLAAEA